ncbi:A24 family peptidase, partial [Tomitella cavernea]
MGECERHMGECERHMGECELPTRACGERRSGGIRIVHPGARGAVGYAAAVCLVGVITACRCAGADRAPAALGALALTGWCAVLGVIDLRTMRLPDVLTLPGAATILAVAAASGHAAAALWGGGLLAGAYLCLHLLRPAAMGAGDVKLAAGLGAATALGGGGAWLGA